ncbi:MAG TPA: MFS transporter [Galbitalea sp.]|jgi:Na+/melibiose symporter-like transporter|nr:MFS transporter [Galbitalea sp.]
MVNATPAAKPGKLPAAFQNLFVSNLATNLGDGVIRTAGPLLAIRLTTDPLLISFLSGLALLPWLFFAIPAGILIDRIDRRVALGIANGVRVFLAVGLVLLYATGDLTIWWLYVAVFVDGACETIYDGAIRAMMPSIVSKELLPTANSRVEAGELVLQNFAAAPLTSLLFGVAVLIPLGSNIGFYALAVVLALLLPRAASGKQFTDVGSEPRPKWYMQFVDGYRFIMASKMFRTLWFFQTFIGLCFSAATAGVVLLVIKFEGLPSSFYGFFLVSGAVGGIVGSIVASPLKRAWGAGVAMAVSMVVSCAALVFIGLVPVIWAAAVGFFLSTLSIIVWNVLVMSLRQGFTPGRLLGRVHGTYRTLLWGATPVGSVVGGLIGRVNLTYPFIFAGGIGVIATIVFFRFIARLPNPEDVDNGDRPDTDLGYAGLPRED